MYNTKHTKQKKQYISRATIVYSVIRSSPSSTSSPSSSSSVSTLASPSSQSSLSASSSSSCFCRSLSWITLNFQQRGKHNLVYFPVNKLHYGRVPLYCFGEKNIHKQNNHHHHQQQQHFKLTSVSASVYSLTRSTDTTLVSTSLVFLTRKFKADVTYNK